MKGCQLKEVTHCLFNHSQPLVLLNIRRIQRDTCFLRRLLLFRCKPTPILRMSTDHTESNRTALTRSVISRFLSKREIFLECRYMCQHSSFVLLNVRDDLGGRSNLLLGMLDFALDRDEVGFLRECEVLSTFVQQDGKTP